MDRIRIREGFPNQLLFRLPPPVLRRWESHPLLQSLILTDFGWFPHAHYHYCERPQGAQEHILILCVGGEGWCEVNGRSTQVLANEAILIPQGMPHTYGASAAAPWSIHWAHFRGSEGDFYASHVPGYTNKLLVERSCRDRVEHLFAQCYDLLIEGFVLSRLVHGAQILHHILGELFYNNPAFLPAQRTNQFRSIEPTLDYLRQHIDQRLPLADMAEHAGLSIPHFSRLFRQQTGYSPTDYFIHLKIQRALSLLLLSSKTVREIAMMVGYTDPYYFSRLFKKTVGVSPTAVRQEVQWQIDHEVWHL